MKTVNLTEEDIELVENVLTNHISRLQDHYEGSNSKNKHRLINKANKLKDIIARMKSESVEAVIIEEPKQLPEKTVEPETNLMYVVQRPDGLFIGSSNGYPHGCSDLNDVTFFFIKDVAEHYCTFESGMAVKEFYWFIK